MNWMFVNNNGPQYEPNSTGPNINRSIQTFYGVLWNESDKRKWRVQDWSSIVHWKLTF